MNELKTESREQIFFNDYNNFMNRDVYISKKDKQEFLKINNKFLTKVNKGIYYTNYYKKIKNILKYMDDSIALHNHLFLYKKLEDEEEYFRNLFKGVDDNVKLDKEQKKAILINEDYSMILAGAGSGKTTTMSAKVKYLVDKLGIKSEEIIVISFTNQAVNELKKRINDDFKINAKICTFHKFGIEILKNNTDEHLKVMTNSYNVIKEYFENEILNNKQKLKEFVHFFSLYLDVPTSALKFKTLDDYINYKAKCEYKSLKGRIDNYNEKLVNNRQKDLITIRGEVLKSAEEVMIANFLYLNNIEYEYEKPYPKMYKNKTYLPDFTIYTSDNVYYIEHFGINTKGYNKRYSKKDNIKYKKAIYQKRKLHHYYHTDLIETYSEYKDNRSIIDHLKEELERRNITLKERDSKEIYDILINTGKDLYYSRFITFCLNFINNYKIKGFDKKYFKELKRKNKNNKRILCFLNLIEDIYSYYENYLEKNNYIDFEDMVNKAYKILKDSKKEKLNLNYKYIIIDEYQDISKGRFNLIKEISDISDAKVVAVGDDWQAIFSFSGSDVSLFTKFKELMGYAKELKITKTYRNSQELIDIAGNFVMKNNFQLKKQLISKKKLKNPIKLISFDNNIVDIVNDCIKEIILNYGDSKNILIIGRYSFDKYKIIDNVNFIEQEENKIKSSIFPNVDITFLTAHSSKGLTYDNVIVINNEDDIYGFPSKVEDDPIMDIIKTTSEDYEFAEERRLFYVAITRTRNNTYLVYPKNNPSSFIKEISMYKNVTNIKIKNYLCPKCKKYYLVKRYNPHYNIDLYTCSNDEELCGFKTNNLDYLKEINLCPKCHNGINIVKRNKKNDEYFIGCTNYDKNGCTFTKKL